LLLETQRKVVGYSILEEKWRGIRGALPRLGRPAIVSHPIYRSATEWDGVIISGAKWEGSESWRRFGKMIRSS
jgi:hypothetical protein